ncbi:cytochrome b/b6 domain-containing protein [Pararhizobium antarcticum]|uniref:Cytochrome B n=1 Tax=Pararhizobium antarcticum TaxID=1798805 RepID=A0A657LWF2_9HYPH|nr:cytochrome b/b6 domain-containing protein [Pararhizobium antarcticum]OJF97269.1 cytochrome B [Rhizobium sp. 58]OJF99059.1 cytochrome B [Pararhizobium antarcticum]
MTADRPASRAGASAPAAPSATVAVWDPVVRIFHWGVVAACTLNLFILSPGKTWHRYTGYAVLCLLVLRVVWGFIGSRYARFSDFVRSPLVIRRYIVDLRHGRDVRHLGHNPAAAVMMVVLMILLLATAMSGWMMTLDAFWGNALIEEAHEVLANSIMVLAGLHALAAIVESVRHRENLVLAMVTGRKKA